MAFSAGCWAKAKRIDADIVAVRVGVGCDVAEGQSTAQGAAEACECDNVLCPGGGVTGGCIGRIDLQQKVGKVADGRRSASNFGTGAVSTEPNFEIIGEELGGLRVKAEGVAVIQRQSGQDQPVADIAAGRGVGEIGTNIGVGGSGLRRENSVALKPAGGTEGAAVVGKGPAISGKSTNVFEIVGQQVGGVGV